MAEGPLKLELTSPTHPPVSMNAARIMLPGADGVLTVYPGHTPLLTTLGHGAVIAFGDGPKGAFFAVHGGFVEILDDTILVLADQLEAASAIDVKRAEAAKQRAEEWLSGGRNDADVARARAALARATARLQAHRSEVYH